MRSCRRDRSQDSWVIDGPVEVLWDCGAGSIGLTTASLCPDQCPLPNRECCPVHSYASIKRSHSCKR